MTFLLCKDFNEDGIWGHFDLPAKTEVEQVNDLLIFEGKPICVVTSEKSHAFFARNDDGDALERFKNSSAILAKISEYRDAYAAEYDAIMHDMMLPPAERIEQASKLANKASLALQFIKESERLSYFFNENEYWSHDFYNANVADLKYCLTKIKAL